MTSTIASHLPRAVGLALAIDLAARLGVADARGRPTRSSSARFGDASLNHATAQAAINTAAQIAFQDLPLPLLFVCEDNGLGISVPHAGGLGRAALAARPELRYEVAYGTDPRGVRGRAASSPTGSAQRDARPSCISARCAT